MLTFNVKKQWFDKIKSGEKTHEYREVKPSWTGRLAKGLYGTKEFSDLFLIMLLQANFVYKPQKVIKVCFMNGMVSEEKKPRLYGILKSIKIVEGKYTDLKIDKPVYDIEFELVKKAIDEIPCKNCQDILNECKQCQDYFVCAHDNSCGCCKCTELEEWERNQYKKENNQ